MYQEPRTSLWWASYQDQDGKQQRVPLQTRNEAMAKQYDAMVKRLVERDRWDIIQLWRSGRVTLRRLFQAYENQKLPELLEDLAKDEVPDLEPLVLQWTEQLQQGAKKGDLSADTVAHYSLHVRSLVTSGKRFPLTDLTKARVQKWLDELPHKSGTRRKYFMALRAFVRWLLERELLAADPLAGISPPKAGDAHVEYLDAPEVKALILAAEPRFKEVIAVAFATGAEASVLVQLRVRDVEMQRRMIWLAGTKNGYRARWVRVADWCWPVIEKLVQGKATHHRLFPFTTRQVVSKAFRKAADRIGRPTLNLHKARNTFAVRLLKEGAAPRRVAEQLGHADEQMVLKHYGQWIAKHEEYDRDEKRAAGAWSL